MWFDLRPADLSFAERSPFQFRNVAFLPLDADRAFDLLASGEDLREWLDDFRSVAWTSKAPHGVGSTRDVHLKVLGVREQFLAWDRGVRLAFTFTAATIPIVAIGMEDMRLTRLAAKETRVDWTVHYAPPLFMRPFHPILRLVFGKLLRKSARNLERLAKRRA